MCAAIGAIGWLLLVSQAAASTTSISPSSPRSVDAVSICTCLHLPCRDRLVDAVIADVFLLLGCSDFTCAAGCC